MAEYEWSSTTSAQQAETQLRDAFQAEKATEQAARESPAAESAKPETPPNAVARAPKQPAAPKPASDDKSAGPTVAEMVRAREERRSEAMLYRKRAEQIAAYAQQREPSAQKWEAIQADYARGDFEGVARHLGAESWSAVQDHFVRALTDPGHTRVLDLERRMRERDESERQAEQARKQASADARHNEIVEQALASSSDPVLAQVVRLPPNNRWRRSLVQNLREVLREVTRAGGKPITIEQAFRMRRADGSSIEDAVKEAIESFGAARGGDGVQSEPEPPPVRKARPAPKAKSEREVRYGWQPSRKSDDEAWLARGSRELDRAFANERKREAR